jgi:hypothetical protein
MLRNLHRGGERVHLPPAFWNEYAVEYWSDVGWVARRLIRPAGATTIPRAVGVVFYVWRPAFDRLWQQAEEPRTSETLEPPEPPSRPAAKPARGEHGGPRKGAGAPLTVKGEDTQRLRDAYRKLSRR